MDILGFSEMVKRAGSNAAVLYEVHEALRVSLSFLKPIPVPGLNSGMLAGYDTKAFTDNVVVGVPSKLDLDGDEDGESPFGMAMELAWMYQSSLTLRGFFVRGGLAHGPHFMDESLVYGPALVRAHEIESRAAIAPRIMLDDSVVALAMKHTEYYCPRDSSPQDYHLLRDSDGSVFVNYLAGHLDFLETASERRDLLKRHREVVCERLSQYESAPRVWSKYAWSATYHNHVVRTLGPRHHRSLIVREADLVRSPRPFVDPIDGREA